MTTEVQTYSECPYADDEVIYDLRMASGRTHTGRFVSVGMARPFWTLVPEADDDGAFMDGWLDINPAYVEALAPADSAATPTQGRLKP